MSFLIDLLTFPVMGPIKGVVWIAGKVGEQAEKEIYSEGAVRGQLMELELRFDLGEINEEEYMEAEEVLLARLKVIRERQAAQREA